MKNLGYIIAYIIIASIVGLIIFAGARYMIWRDSELMKAVKSYEECIEKQYGGHTPLQVKNATGSLPECVK